MHRLSWRARLHRHLRCEPEQFDLLDALWSYGGKSVTAFEKAGYRGDPIPNLLPPLARRV